MKHFVKSSSYVLIGNIASKFISLMTLGIISRSLNSDNFGNYSAIQNTALSTSMIGSAGIPTVMQMKSASISIESKNELNSIISSCILTYIGLNAIIGFFLLLFPQIFSEYLLSDKMDVSYNIYLVALLLVISVNQIPIYFLMGLGAFREYAVLNLKINFFTLLCVSLFLLLYVKSLQSALLASIISNLFAAFLTTALFSRLMKKNELTFIFKPNINNILYIIKSGFMYYLGNTLLVSISGFITIAVFYKYLSSEEYGYIRIAASLTALLGILPNSIQPVTLSKVFIEGDQESLSSFQFRLIPFLTLVLVLLIAPVVPTIISAFFGAEYIRGAYFVYVLILLQIPHIYLGVLINFILANGMLSFAGFIAIIGTSVFSLSVIWLVPELKLDGYLAATFASTMVSLLIIIPKLYHKISFFNKTTRFSLVINAFVLIVLITIQHYAAPGAIFLTPMLLAVYCGLSYSLCVLPEEKKMLKNLLNKTLR